jgi:hypothetical protein
VKGELEMNIETFLSDLLIAVITVAIPIISKYIISYLGALKDKKIAESEATEASTFENTIIEAIELVQKVVDKVSQTYVDSLKAKGEFTKEAQVESFNMALSDAKTLISDEVQTLINSIYGDFDKWLEVQIESYIKIRKE